MQHLLTSLAYQSLLKAKNQLPDGSGLNIIEKAWEIYLQMTRYSPGCAKKDFVAWAYAENQMGYLNRPIKNLRRNC